MTKMGKALDTTLFIKNGPCMAGLGLGGEGYCSFSIAGPTGEGVTTPLTFTRERRCSMIESLRSLENRNELRIGKAENRSTEARAGRRGPAGHSSLRVRHATCPGDWHLRTRP